MTGGVSSPRLRARPSFGPRVRRVLPVSTAYCAGTVHAAARPGPPTQKRSVSSPTLSPRPPLLSADDNTLARAHLSLCLTPNATMAARAAAPGKKKAGSKLKKAARTSGEAGRSARTAALVAAAAAVCLAAAWTTDVAGLSSSALAFISGASGGDAAGDASQALRSDDPTVIVPQINEGLQMWDPVAINHTRRCVGGAGRGRVGWVWVTGGPKTVGPGARESQRAQKPKENTVASLSAS